MMVKTWNIQAMNGKLQAMNLNFISHTPKNGSSTFQNVHMTNFILWYGENATRPKRAATVQENGS